MKLSITLLFILLSTAGIKAQTTTPTKEQTINYLKENFFNKEIRHLKTTDKFGQYRSREWNIYTYGNIEINNCLITIPLNKSNQTTTNSPNPGEHLPTKNTSETLTINFSKVESITTTQEHEVTGGSDMGDVLYKIVFHVQEPGGKILKIEIPNRALKATSVFDPLEDTVFKAFNHLRKLCGAPEPLKF